MMVFLPSIGRGNHEFIDLACGLARHGLRVLLPEPRGFEGSTGPTRDITLYDLAEDVGAVIRQEGGGPAIVLGHAFGNWVARLLATASPELVRSVGLIAAASGELPKSLILDVELSADVLKPEDRRLEALRRAFFAHGNDPNPWLNGWNKAVNIYQREAASRVPSEVWFAAGNVPILDLQGACDPFRPVETRRDLRNALGDRVTVRVIENASHALPAEKPAEVVAAVTDWVARL
jgi:pimeloyl-ACP methyl ester carboxylesterase